MRLDVRVKGGKGRVPSEIGTEPDRVGIRAMESRPLKWTTMGLLTIVLLSDVTGCGRASGGSELISQR